VIQNISLGLHLPAELPANLGVFSGGLLKPPNLGDEPQEFGTFPSINSRNRWIVRYSSVG
jgi:hypothetical protein